MALKEPGLFADGSGLYLRVDQTGARRWVWIFHYHKKRREMGLGSLEVVGLADARAAADVARRILADGRDPIEERRLALMPSTSRLFSAVASDLMDALEPSWKSPKQRGQWEASLMQHAGQIWKADVSAVDTAMVLEALKPVVVRCRRFPPVVHGQRLGAGRTDSTNWRDHETITTCRDEAFSHQRGRA
ncbi:Arm DNA-binding domain-containing protein [Brevundimonas nasdae]|uniref:Arm DNA-binding domain-containing protein n=2 Tax=Brevundimonas nasdae TaxID=172043 RepID=A0ABX8TIG7_9CAUL|nr:Arm DNA-binding domain-containing protein [Brevundimonas nasdae]QYC11015.1 Arm DNA-binding domain-containing protein [Brevundimonas nasdae]QYC13801.1 Arm DNA-binding domain-containing protein [Brevundimonas nasdae]